MADFSTQFPKAGNTTTIVDTLSPLVGSIVHMPSTKFAGDQQAIEAGFIPIKEGTYSGLAASNPVAASLHPQWVSGSNFIFTDQVAGMFLRNVGGNAAAEGAFQDDGTDVNGLMIGYCQENDLEQGWSGAGDLAVWGTDREDTNTSQPFDSNDSETRPVNFAFQAYIVADNYRDVGYLASLPTVPALNTEQATNDRWVDGKVIYQQIVQSPLANAALSRAQLYDASGLPMPASGYLGHVVSISFVAAQDSGPDVYTGNDNHDYGIADSSSTLHAFHSPNGNWSGYTGTWIVKYTKS